MHFSFASAALVATFATFFLPTFAAPPPSQPSCGPGFYVSGNDCKPCLNPLAETCNRLGQTLACKAPLFRSGNACVERCHTWYFGNSDRICWPCPPFSASCTAAGSTSCQNGYDLVGKACLKSCTAGKYRGECVNCLDSKAATCDSLGATLACKDGLVKSADGCRESCGEGFFANSARICTACTGEGVKACTATGPTSCNSGFKLSSDKKKCIRGCEDGFWLSGTACKACGPNAERCDIYGRALTCKAPFVRSGSYYATACHPLYYANADRVCILCPPNSSACTADGPTKCQSGYALSEDKKRCVKTCPAGQRLSGSSCVDCGAGVATCDSNGAALTCAVGKVKAGTSCQDSCDEGSYPNQESVCTACNGQNVKTCTSSSPTACNSGFFLSSDGKECVASCGSAEYASDQVCKSCPANASSCGSTGTILTCQSGFVKDGPTCSSSCPQGSYADSNSACTACPANAESCTATEVKACNSGYSISSDLRSCVKVCDAGFWLSGSDCIACGPGVTTCDSNGVALTCAADKVKAGTACQDRCDEGSYPNQDSVCTACAGENVKTCTSSGPTACNSGFFLSSDGKECVGSCGSAEYALDGVCKSCPANASSCDSDGALLTCQSGFVKYGSTCSSSCPQGTYADSNSACAACTARAESCTANEVTACNSGYSVSSDSKSCVKVCNAGFWLSGSECIACGGGAATCDSDGTALTCATGKVKAGTSCLDSCPDGSYANQDSVCSPCGENVKTCTSADVVTCMPGFLISRDVKSCVATCRPAEWAMNGVMCAPCRTGAATCDNDGRTLTCKEGLVKKGLGCFESCAAGDYVQDGECKSCPGENASICSSDGSTTLSCTSPFLLDGGQCVQSCSAGKYSTDGLTCSPCTGNAATCTADGHALTCLNGLFASNEACVEFCPDSTFGIDGVCQACPSRQLSCPVGGVPTCTEGSVYDVDSKACLEQCADESWRFGSSCYASGCPDGSFAWNTELSPAPAGDHPKQCYACTGKNVATCTQTTALTCINDQYALATAWVIQDSCLFICPAAYYPVGFTNQCAACPSGAIECTRNGVATRCETGKFLNPTSPPTCSTTCIAGYRKQDDAVTGDTCGRCPNYNIGVVTCDARGDHTSCIAGYEIQDAFYDICVITCPAGTYRTAPTTCTACPSGAKTCDANGVPTSCLTGLVKVTVAGATVCL